MKVSVVIPNWNGLVHLKTCLPSVTNQTFKDFEVIIIDNGSTDDSIKYISSIKHQTIKLIINKLNLGFAKAVNQGIKAAAGKYILLLNNDTKVDKNCLKFLVEVAEKNNKIGFFAPLMLNFNNPNLIDNAGDSIDVVGHLITRGFGQPKSKFQRSELIFAASGGGSLFRKKVFDVVGLFDEDYFFYMEDIDLCFRAQLVGFRGLYVPEAIIYHKRQGTAKKSIRYEVMVFKNMTQTIIKNFPVGLLLKNFNWAKIILVHLNTIRYLITRGLILETIQVELWLFFNIYKLSKKRSRVQSLKVVSDQYLLKQILPKFKTLQ